MTRRMNEIVWFRAIAIIVIVAGHSLAGVHAAPDTIVNAVLFNLLKGGTALFVFISGFLFDYVYLRRFEYWVFMRDKIRRVLIPYLVLTTIVELLILLIKPQELSLQSVIMDYVLGDTLYAYWYVPFIMLMFAISPLYVAFSRLDLRLQGLIVAVLIGLAGIIQRPVDNHDPVQAVLFYLPIYLVGMMASANRARVMPALGRWAMLFLLAAVAVATLQSALGQTDNLHKPLFAIQGFEMMGIQKILLSLGLLGLFVWPVFGAPRLINLIAETSFAVFFLHLFFVQSLEHSGIFVITGWMWVDLMIEVAFVMAACIGLALLLRRLLGKASTYIIGY